MIVLTLISILFLLWSIYYHLSKFRLYKMSRNVPGPLALPFIGSAYLFIGSVEDIAQRITKLYIEYPEFAKVWIGPNLFYIITKPEYLEIILHSPHALKKVDLYEGTKAVFGNGLITAPVNTWKSHRKTIQPSFNPRLLNQYPPIISGKCNVLLQTLQNVCGREIDVYNYITNCTVDVVCATMFRLPSNDQIARLSYGYMFDAMMEGIFLQMIHIFYQFEFIYKYTKKYKDFMKLVRLTRKTAWELVEKKIDQKKSEASTDDKIKSFLDLAVDKYLKKEWSRIELEDEVVTMLLAGSDTTATTLSYTLMMLGMHQEIQEKVYKEAVEVLGSSSLVQLDDLPKLSYTERVIKESQRLFPAASLTARYAEEDINLGDAIIPKHSNIAFSSLILQRNGKYWTDPLNFDPDRFLPERSSEIHPVTWLPFSWGPRNCVGFKFAGIMSKILISMTIRKFKVTCDLKRVDQIELKPHILLKPKNGFKIRLELR